MSNNFFKAVCVLVGYIVGVGMFGLPFLISQAGLMPFIVLMIVLASVQHFLHLVYANIIAVNKENHHLPGFAGIYLGPSGRAVASIAKLAGDICALLAYLIITGIFLNSLLAPIFGENETLYTTIAFILQAIIIYFGIGWLARMETLMTVIMIAAVGIIFFQGYGSIKLVNYQLVDLGKFFLPFGALLFAIDGTGAMPIIARLMGNDRHGLRRVVKAGTLISVAIITVFTLTIVGLTGAATTPDALTGARAILSSGLIFLALLFGLLAIITSFLGVAESLKISLKWDYRVHPKLAWFIALFLPYVLYLCGLKNLTEIISFAGAVSGGISAIILIFIFLELEKAKGKLPLFKSKPSRLLLMLIIMLFIFGIVNEIVHFAL